MEDAPGSFIISFVVSHLVFYDRQLRTLGTCEDYLKAFYDLKEIGPTNVRKLILDFKGPFSMVLNTLEMKSVDESVESIAIV